MSDGPEDDLITAAEAAALAGVTPSTFRTYELRGYAPKRVRMYGVTPVWSRAEVEAWLESRPGAGARTDLRKTTTNTEG